jgi:ApaG protein
MQVEIKVKTRHIEEQTDVNNHRFVFAYIITIKNHESVPVKLFNRYWLITDANGKKVEVRGAGVVGEQPEIEPGEDYTYTSGCILETEVGTMEGFYEMSLNGGELEAVTIPVFRLAVPKVLH